MVATLWELVRTELGLDEDLEKLGRAKTHVERGSGEHAETRHGCSAEVMMCRAWRRFCMQPVPLVKYSE